MSENVNKTVLTDETGKKILDALYGIAWRLDKQNELLAAANEKPKDVYFVEATYTDGKHTLVTADADLQTAYENGKDIVLKLTDTATNKAYYTPLGNAFTVGTGKGFIFYAGNTNNPELLTSRCYTIANGKIIASESQVKTVAQCVSCSVTIGGTEYTTLDAALAALAAQ